MSLHQIELKNDLRYVQVTIAIYFLIRNFKYKPKIMLKIVNVYRSR